MRAKVGDRIRVPGRRVGDATRSGVVVDVRGDDGAPPFVVRWDGDGPPVLPRTGRAHRLIATVSASR